VQDRYPLGVCTTPLARHALRALSLPTGAPLLAMDAANASSSAFTSVLANAKYGGVAVPPQLDYVVDAITTASPWALLLTIFAVCVVYDQSMLLTLHAPSPSSFRAPFRAPSSIHTDDAARD